MHTFYISVLIQFVSSFPFFTFKWPCIVINFPIIKQTRCTNFSNLFWKWNSTYFGQFLCPSSAVIHSTLAMVYVIQVCRQLSSRIRMELQLHPDPTRMLSLWHIPLLSVQWITPDGGQRNSPKHVEFHFQNKFEKLVHLLVFIIGKFVLSSTRFEHLMYMIRKTIFYIQLFMVGYSRICASSVIETVVCSCFYRLYFYTVHS
jgi:hypothetical protein